MKVKRRYTAFNKKKALVLTASAGLLLLIAVGALIWLASRQPVPTQWDVLTSMGGMVTTIGQEESDFYKGLILKEKPDVNELGREDIAEYAGQTYALYLIGQKLDLCSPYSYQNLKLELEQENNRRKAKAQNGEVYYGSEQFDQESYFHYRLDAIKRESIKKLSENPDEKLTLAARAYWEQNPEPFTVITEITYHIEADGQTEMKTITREDLTMLGKTDAKLADILENGKEGQSFQYQYGDSERKGSIVAVTRTGQSFEEVKDQVVETYVAQIEYPKLLEQTAQKNPVEIRQ